MILSDPQGPVPCIIGLSVYMETLSKKKCKKDTLEQFKIFFLIIFLVTGIIIEFSSSIYT